MEQWGFYITFAGTAFSLISLLATLFIVNNTSKIRSNLFKRHLKDKYRKSKKSILLQLYTSYSLNKDDKIVDEQLINESIISLFVYDEILTFTTKRKLKKLKKNINDLDFVQTANGKREIRNLQYEIIKRLENEFDEQIEYLKEAVK